MKVKTDKKSLLPLRSPAERLAALRQIRGMWKNRKPDPIHTLKNMRKEWERELP